jgi:nitrite reductase (NADH) small subunit/3-phenylpropionate/trans-cinnamate dioxygenase ferredoxin subunit
MLKTELRLTNVADVPVGGGKVVEVDGQEIAVFNVDGTLCAIDNLCPHRGGPLGEGKLNGNIVTCPWHRHEFNVKTGEIVSLLIRPNVKTYPVTIEESDIVIELD